ncbi:MAG: phosphoheptose isomerase [Rhodopirellula sp.]|nr:phosphoheptose isomerase [Rhodopirellula sp.]
MLTTSGEFELGVRTYLTRLNDSFNNEVIENINLLAQGLREAWCNGKNVYICGNGGSAGNAIHLANDLHYGIGACGNGEKCKGIKVEALPANGAILTCLANDIGYENVFSHQLETKADEGDLLIVLSGSGNSKNIISALHTGKRLGMQTYAILGYKGGQSKEIADVSIHFSVNDMQIAEDTQIIVGHMCMQWLSMHKPTFQRPKINARTRLHERLAQKYAA